MPKLFFWHWKGFKRITKRYRQEGFKTHENQDTVSNPCRWFDKIEGLLIHPRNRGCLFFIVGYEIFGQYGRFRMRLSNDSLKLLFDLNDFLLR